MQDKNYEILDYKILADTDPVKLQNEIVNLVKAGYVLHGTICHAVLKNVDGELICSRVAMVLYK